MAIVDWDMTGQAAPWLPMLLMRLTWGNLAWIWQHRPAARLYCELEAARRARMESEG